MNGFDRTMAWVDGHYYNVADYPREKVAKKGPKALNSTIIYRIETTLTKGLFPYRGIMPKRFNPTTAPVGIYFKDPDEPRSVFIVRPRTAKERRDYSLNQARSLKAVILGNEVDSSELFDIGVNLSATGNAWLPPMHAEDDALNTIMKMAIRLKEAPFEPYGKRLEAMAVDKHKSTEGTNTKNNAKRALKVNNTMSAFKFQLYADVWDLQSAIIVRDKPGAKNPMFPDGSMLVIFPNDEEFDIDKDRLVDIKDLVAEAIAETRRGANTSRAGENEED